MNTRKTISLVLFTVALASGCIPEKRIVWSPDGTRAALATPKGLFLIDADGRVLPPRITDTPARCAWFPDGKRLLVVHATAAKSYDQLIDVLSPEHRARIERFAEDTKAEMLRFEGPISEFKMDPNDQFSGGSEVAAIVYLRDKSPGGLPEKLGESWDEIKKVDPQVWRLEVFSIEADAFKSQSLIARSLDEFAEPSVSPDGNLVAFMASVDDEDHDVPSLHVASLAGPAPRIVARNVSMFYDWSPDARSLAYFRSGLARSDEQLVQLGSLTTTRIADPAGKLLDPWAETNDRVGVLFTPSACVRWMSDGRLMFSSVEMTLPATTRDMPQRWSIYVLDPRMPASAIRVLGRDFNEPLANDLAYFDLSPDESTLLLSGAGGQWHTYELVSGKTSALIDDPDRDEKTKLLASFRKDGAIALSKHATSAEPSQRLSELFLLKDAKSQCLSNSWTQDMKDGWLQND